MQRYIYSKKAFQIQMSGILLIAVFVLLPAVAAAQFADGSGTEEDPYQVETVQQLQAIADSANLDKHFILVADIDALDTEYWNDGKGFEPISGFTGSFNGAGYIISNLFIDRKESGNIGLFSHLDGYIENLGLEEVNIIGDSQVGGLVGSLGDGGVIRSTYITGKVTGNWYVGGLVGSFNDLNIERNRIHSVYTDVQVTGKFSVGGLVGVAEEPLTIGKKISYEEERTETTVSHSWAVGEVKETDKNESSFIGGLIGVFDGLTAHALYWDTLTTRQDRGFGTMSEAQQESSGLTSGQMTGQDAFIHMYELDFDQTWQLTEGYPVLAWQNPENAVDPPEVPIIRIAPKEEEYDYGQVETDSFATRFYTLRNTGNIAMSVEVSLTDTHNSVFAIIQGEGDYTLEPNSSRVIEVEFRPASADTFQTILEIHHDAPNRDDPLEVTLNGKGKQSTSVDEQTQLPRQPELRQNYPNPFNPDTIIRFAIPERTHVQITVYNVIGQKVATLVNEVRSAGWHEVDFDADGLSSGIFLYRMGAGEQVEVKQMTLIK